MVRVIFIYRKFKFLYSSFFLVYLISHWVSFPFNMKGILIGQVPVDISRLLFIYECLFSTYFQRIVLLHKVSLIDSLWIYYPLSVSWWWTGRPGVLRFMGSQRVVHDWATELNWIELKCETIIAWHRIPQRTISQLLSHVQLFVTLCTAAHQTSMSITNSRSLLKLMSIELVMPSNHLILC